MWQMTTKETPLDVRELVSIVESLLFVADTPLSLRQLADIVSCDLQTMEAALHQLAQDRNGGGVRLQRHGEQVQLVTCAEAMPYVERLLGLNQASRLSSAALETLAIVAYRQPVTRAEVEAIRGVGSDGVLRTLLGRGLVKEVGRQETVGRPVLLGTTFEFLQYFGLEALEELPPLDLPADGRPGATDR
jgi:segregation and condensation protein B